MTRPILKTDSPRRIVLEAPRGGGLLLAVLLAAAALAVGVLAPGLWIAPGLLALFALAALAGTLRIHQLRLDREERRDLSRRGWRFAPTRRRGSFEEIAGVFIDRNEPDGGLEASRLRSRLIRLELSGWGEEGVFTLGFPMGPRVAAEKAAGYARRLGVGLVDRTAGGGEVRPDEMQ